MRSLPPTFHPESQASFSTTMSHEHGAHTHDYAAANQKRFDAEAKAFDAKPSVMELAKRVTKAMVERYPSLFDEEKTSLLDFACGTGAPIRSRMIVSGSSDGLTDVDGTGVLSRELCSHVKSIVGVDISQGMVC